MIAMPCIPPGALCALRGGVLVSTVTPRQRMAGGWYNRDTTIARCDGVALRVVGAVVADGEHVQGRDPPLLGEADFHAALKAGRAPDVVFLLAADAHHDRGVGLLRQQRRDDHRDAAGDLAAEAAARVFADEARPGWDPYSTSVPGLPGFAPCSASPCE